MTSTMGETYARPRRRNPWLSRIVVLLVVVVVLLVVLDRGGDYVAERIAADNLQSSQHLRTRPDVSIDGVPFLTQFAARKYDHISVDADDLPVADGALNISRLHVDLNRLTVSRDFATFHVGSATADATISYADLSSRLGVTVTYAGNNRIKAAKTIDLPVIGTVSPTISVRPALVNGALTFGKSSINGAGDNLAAVSSALKKIFNVSVSLDGLPFDVMVRSLTVDSTGLHAKFVGADLTFDKSD